MSRPESHGAPEAAQVSCAEISRLVQSAGSAHTFVRPDLEPGDAAVEGRFQLWQLKSGMFLHATELRDLHDLTTQLVIDRGLTISVILNGVVDFSIDDRHFIAGTTGQADGRPGVACSAVMVTDDAMLTRRAHKDARTRKVNISIDGDWLDAMTGDSHRHDAVRRFVTSHLAHANWRASPRLVALAEQILNPPNLCSYLKEMYVESRGIDLVAEALTYLAGDAEDEDMRGPSARETLRARAARDYIESNLDRTLSLGEIARETGLSPTSLQRQFKAAYGTTVVDFLRARKLERAREAIEREGRTISEAAYLAGYSNPANFTTAFKRAFGMPPRSIRR